MQTNSPDAESKMKTQAAVFGNTARLREKLVLGKNAEEVVALDDHLTLQRAEPEQHPMICDLIKKLRTSPTQTKSGRCEHAPETMYANEYMHNYPIHPNPFLITS